MNNQNFTCHGLKISIWCLVMVQGMASCLYCQQVDSNQDVADRFNLSRKVKTSLDAEIFPAMTAGDDQYFFEAFGTMLPKIPDEMAEEIERYAESLNLESPLQHFVALKMMRIEQGIDDPNARMSLKETMYLIKGINGRLSRFFDSIDQHQLMKEPMEVPEHWKESRELFWQVHVIKNEFTNIGKLLEFGSAIMQPVKNRIKRSQNATVKSSLDSFVEFYEAFPRRHRELVEREADARLERFDRSINALNSGGDFESSFIAAMNIELDAEVLQPFLNQSIGFQRVNLRGPGLSERLNNDLQAARALEPDLLRKAAAFREACHWWLRGRYGFATEANGLLKSRRSLQSDQAMTELYMPRIRPKINGAEAGTESLNLPIYDRRHHYTWAVEYRPFEGGKKHKTIDHSVRTFSNVKTEKFSDLTYFL